MREEPRPLLLLHLEDDPRDAEITLGALEDGGFLCEEERVDTRAAFVRALEGGRPFDVILADYVLPGFDAVEALAIARRLRPDVPFIMISGRVGEEVAIDMLHAGATDYVLKQRLGRLVPAVNRALRERERERENARAAARVRELSERLAEKGLLEQILSHLPTGVIVARAPGGEILTMNDRARRLFTADGADGIENLHQLAEVSVFLPDGRRATEADFPSVRALTSGALVQDVLLELRPAAGPRAFVYASAAPVRAADGAVLAIVATEVDVTRLRAAEEEMRRLAEFPEENPNPVLRAALDGRCLYANKPAIRLLGSMGWREGALLPDVLRRHLERVSEGSAADVELPDSAGAIYLFTLSRGAGQGHVNVYGRDISSLKLATREQMRLGAIVESSDDAILSKDLDGTILSWNAGAERIFGYSAAEAVGRSVTMLLPSDRPDEEDGILRRLADGERIDHFETRRVAKDGTVLDVSVTISPLRDSEGRVVGASTIARDVTDRNLTAQALRQANERLREEDRRKNEFLGMLSHELRNPLAPIRNSLYILSRAAAGGEQARRALAVIDRQTQHLSRLVDDLLDVTRIARGKIRLQREPLELQELTRGTVEDHRELFARNGIDLAFAADTAPVHVCADPTRLAQAIGNLLQNAAKFTPRGGRTEVSVERTAGFGVVTVRDTGAGIAPDVLARLFQPFVQAESTLDRSSGGLGLGLALVKGLMELQGGTASAHSEGPGKGSAFTLRVPLERRRAPRLELVPNRPAKSPARRVLVIEDNIDAAESLKEVLELGDHAVEVALSGPDGVQKARALRPDVIISDIGLPGMDGFQVAKAIRADPRLRDTVLIALSGYAQPEDLQASREAGFDAHLAKPPSPEAVERAMQEIPARAQEGA